MKIVLTPAQHERRDPRMIARRSDSIFDLSGQVAIVTGTSRGLGQYFARALAKRRRRSRSHQPHARHPCAIRSGDQSPRPPRHPARARRARPREHQTHGREAEAAFGQIHILVNNAGCNVRKPALDVTWDDWNLILDTNLRGAFFVAQAVARGMVASGYGRIINIGSVTSVFGYAGLAPYGASRGGIRQLTMSLPTTGAGTASRSIASRRDGFAPSRTRCSTKIRSGSTISSSAFREAPRPAARSRWSRGLSRLRIQPLRHRPDAAGGWRHLDRRTRATVSQKSGMSSDTLFALRPSCLASASQASARATVSCRSTSSM